MAQLLASGHYFDTMKRYHHHDPAVRGTLNTILCSLTLFDIHISSLKTEMYLQLNNYICACNNCDGDSCIHPK